MSSTNLTPPPPPLCVAGEPPSSLPGTLGTVTVAPRLLNAHPKNKLVNSIIITLFCIILIYFAIPSRGRFWLLRGCVHNPHTEFFSKLGSVFYGTARLMYADNCIARTSEFECLHKQTGSQA